MMKKLILSLVGAIFFLSLVALPRAAGAQPRLEDQIRAQGEVAASLGPREQREQARDARDRERDESILVSCGTKPVSSGCATRRTRTTR